ncbi:hypothetical protein [Polaribacter porphyrae]|uniref:Uncharacterized protein n=1 Tax=Polaribacter porphyrae TaxID=1137780 RepID=A0A2S7WQ38_9FLAO|nr:hypothetical protein [Polaribacter porphyrae]PQJ79556.1 hypothetical protein BTO18_10400 [Polaribacter porphyrae]
MEKCFACKKDLKGINTPLFNISKTSDGKKACTICHRKISVSLSKTNFNKHASQELLNASEIKLEKKKRIPIEKPNKKKEEKVYKWYLRKRVLLLLLFLFPPLGIVGIFKRDVKLWKRVIYILVSIFFTPIIFGLIITLLNPIDFYSEGNNFYHNKDYTKAIEKFSLVEEGDENYLESQSKIKLSNYKLDSLRKKEEEFLDSFKKVNLKNQQKKVEKLKKQLKYLKAFQKRWSDSIVKDFKGSYIKKSKVSIGIGYNIFSTV